MKLPIPQKSDAGVDGRTDMMQSPLCTAAAAAAACGGGGGGGAGDDDAASDDGMRARIIVFLPLVN